ncbi:MAG: PLP-dependent aminotransferase family protein [Spirochaetales bacterium]|nr:PLP-dependent aminotransferase family protein [Spirochaetales bacterium]
MLLLSVDRQRKIPLFKQISEQIRRMISIEVLKEGDRLPSTRELANQLKLNRSTISRAYEELWALGFLESSSGTYTRVRKRAALKATELNEAVSAPTHLNLVDKLTPSCKKMISSLPKTIRLFEPSEESKDLAHDSKVIDLSTLSPDPQLWPVDEFRKTLNHQISFQGKTLFDYDDPAGNLGLRTALAEYLGRHQINLTPDELIITNGAQGALDLIFRSLISTGNRIITEKPTYSYIMPLSKYYGANLIQIPTDHSGMDLKILEKTLKKEPSSIIYTMPNFQNPMGISTTQEHRENLLRICETYKAPLIEDGFLEELKYTGKTILPIKSMDKKDYVIYIGSFSKVLFPSLRIGWIAANPSYIEKLIELRRMTELSGNAIIQATMAGYLNNGMYEKYVRKIHTKYRERLQVAMQAARSWLDLPGLKFTKPSGGFLFWISWENPPCREDYFLKKIQSKNISLTPGSRFFASPQVHINMRISIARANPEEISLGIKEIGSTIREILREKQ